MNATGSRAVQAVNRLNRATRANPLLRTVAVATYRNAVRLQRFLPPPRVIVNGPAKSGTHLLADCLSLLPRMMFSGRHFIPAAFDLRTGDASAATLDVPRLRRYLDRCPDGMFVTTHAAHRPALDALWDELGFRKLLLVRDPRDIAVSLSHFIGGQPWLRRYDSFTERFPTPSDRLLAVITGYEAEDDRLPGIARVVETYRPWLDAQGVLVVRYEDLVGPAGGGDAERQARAVAAVAEHVDRTLDRDGIGRVAEAMYSKHGLTFRAGRTGDWRDEFGPEHHAAWQHLSPNPVAVLGYDD